MTLTVDGQTVELSEAARRRLEADARAQGKSVADVLAERLSGGEGVAEREPAAPQDGPMPSSPTLALFADWKRAEATDDAAELARRNREGDALMESLRANRLSLRPADLQTQEDAA